MFLRKTIPVQPYSQFVRALIYQTFKNYTQECSKQQTSWQKVNNQTHLLYMAHH